MRKYAKHIRRGLLALILMIIVIHVVSALTLDRRIRYTETSFAAPEIPAELDGYVIALVTDTHELAPEKLRQVVAKMNARKVDLLLLGGDYAAGDGLWQTMEILSQTKTTDGIYGVDGNHDNYWELYKAMRKFGITPLDNRGLYVRPGFYLAGVPDAWIREPDVVKATANAEPVDFVLLLSHNPDVSMQQDTAKVDVMLSGHTHGGIMTFFGVWAPALYFISDYGHKFKGGWVATPNNTAVFVSRGAGSHKVEGVPVLPRIFAPPEVVYLTLRRE